MASSRKSPRDKTLVDNVATILNAHVPAGARLVAGLSGGIDSVVLLHLLKQVARRQSFELAAVHVNHQLNPASSQWAKFCRALCRKLDVPLTVAKVVVPREASLEAAARKTRYAVYARLRADFIVLAHNADDQAETLLLQLLRGTGVKGGSAMPVAIARRHAAALLRPLLGVSRADIEHYAAAHGLEWVEDDSNANIAFDRNFVRHRVLPVIAERFPAYRTTFARASRNFADAAHLLEELAAIDIGPRQPMRLQKLRALSTPRARNVIRRLLSLHGVAMPSEVRLDECVRQAQTARNGSFAVDIGTHEFCAYDGELHVVAKYPVPESGFFRVWQGEARLDLPDLGVTLLMKRTKGAGINALKLRSKPVTVRLREGGETFRPDARRPRRTLKNLLQEARVAPWMRERLPLLYSGDSLVFVPGIGIDIGFAAQGQDPSFSPEFRPRSA